MKWLQKFKGVEHAKPPEPVDGIREEPSTPEPPSDPEWQAGELVREVGGRFQVRAETRAETKLAIEELKLRKKEQQIRRRQLRQEMQWAQTEYRGKVAGRHNLTGMGRGGVGRMVRVGIQAGRSSDRMQHDRTLQGLEAQRNACDSDIYELDRLILQFEQYARDSWA
jgi:hypothetical protein